MSPAHRHRTLLQIARDLEAVEVRILFRGKHPALVCRSADGREIRIAFSDSPRAPSQADKFLLRRVQGELGRVRA